MWNWYKTLRRDRLAIGGIAAWAAMLLHVVAYHVLDLWPYVMLGLSTVMAFVAVILLASRKGQAGVEHSRRWSWDKLATQRWWLFALSIFLIVANVAMIVEVYLTRARLLSILPEIRR